MGSSVHVLLARETALSCKKAHHLSIAAAAKKKAASEKIALSAIERVAVVVVHSLVASLKKGSEAWLGQEE